MHYPKFIPRKWHKILRKKKKNPAHKAKFVLNWVLSANDEKDNEQFKFSILKDADRYFILHI